MPKSLGVVIPCYNEQSTIVACLDAVIAQKLALGEIIVVDNGSNDETGTIVKNYAKKHASIRLLREKKQGVQFARNAGLNAAKSDIIARIDADSIVEPDWARQLLEFYQQKANQSVGAASGYSWYYDLPFQRLTHFFTDLFTHVANRQLASSHTIYGSNMTIRRSAWQAIKDEVCMKNGIMEDQDIGYHVEKHGFSTGYIPAARAKVSGRRMRMSPLRFWRYNQQWWRTYANHGLHSEARRIRVAVWLGNLLQTPMWLGLLFHDPDTGHFRLKHFLRKREERRIP